MIQLSNINALDRAYRRHAEDLVAQSQPILNALRLWVVPFRYRNRNLFRLVGYACRDIPGSTFRGKPKEHFRTYREVIAGVLEHCRNIVDDRCYWVTRDGQFLTQYSIIPDQPRTSTAYGDAILLHPQQARFIASAYGLNLHPFICADCSGPLVLRHVRRWDRLSYLCASYPQCPGLCSAHPNGAPVGYPVDRETRRARRLTHEIFDPVWRAAPEEYGVDGEKNPDKFQSIGRARCYAYIAHKMGIPTKNCHIGQLSIAQLRIFYHHCIGLTYTKVRQWHKSKI